MTDDLSARRLTVGGSDAASACGIDPHRSAVMLWAEKTGRVQRAETDARKWGKLLEPVIVGVLEAEGYRPQPAEPARDPKRRWCVGAPDGTCTLDKQPALLEVKTASTWAAPNGSAPVHYQAQIQHYLHLTGHARALLATLVGGQRLELLTVERDDDAIAAILEREEAFVRYLRRDKPPPPDGSKSAREAVLALFPEAEPMQTVRLDRDHWQAVLDLRARREQRDALDEQITALENRIKAAMGVAEVAISPHDTPAAKWTNVHTTRLDASLLKSEQPELHAAYTSHSITRRFTLS